MTRIRGGLIGLVVLAILAVGCVPDPVPDPGPTLRVVTEALPDGVAGFRYGWALEAAGGQEPYAWSATGLPDGVHLDEAGFIVGFPAAVGDSQVTVTVTDARAASASAVLRLSVPEAAPEECHGQGCEVTTLDGATVQVSADAVVDVERDSSGTVIAVHVAGAAPAVGQVAVFAAGALLESGYIGIVTGVAGAGAGVTRLELEASDPGTAYSELTVQAVPGANEVTARSSVLPTSAFSCGGGVELDAGTTTVNTNLKPYLWAASKRPWFGGGGVWLGGGGLETFAAGIEGDIELKLSFGISGAATCSANLPAYRTFVPTGPAGGVIFSVTPTLKIEVEGRASFDTSVTLRCFAHYGWSKGTETRGTHCGTGHEPLRANPNNGAKATLTASLGARVTWNEIGGIYGNIDASLTADYQPSRTPQGRLSAKSTWDISGCLLCFWKNTPAKVSFANGTIFDKVLAQWGTVPGGPADPPDTTPPTSVPPDPPRNAAAITAGFEHTCALTVAGGVKCWGDNWDGQLGDGTATDRTTAADVVGLGSGVAAIAGGGYHTCALTVAGGVKCWGHNWAGQLGDGTATDRATPVDVVGLGSGVAAIAGGGYQTCALTTSGGVKCWGHNADGELGDGSTTDRATPVDVVGLDSGATAITASLSHSCAVTASGRVKCWGAGVNGELGDGTAASRETPVDVVGLDSGATAVAAGAHHSCAVTRSGSVKCWGSNRYGALGDGTTTTRLTPVDVTGLDFGATAITAGRNHTCVLTTAGGANCWGRNRNGQLGDGTIAQRSTPVAVVGFP